MDNDDGARRVLYKLLAHRSEEETRKPAVASRSDDHEVGMCAGFEEDLRC